MAQQRQHGAFVRNGQPQAAGVARAEGAVHKSRPAGRCHVNGDERRINAVALKLMIKKLGRTHLVHGVAEDEKNACAASDLHGLDDRQLPRSRQVCSLLFAR